MLKFILSLCIVLGQFCVSDLNAAPLRAQSETTLSKTDIDKMERELIDMINLKRNEKGLTSLSYSKELSDCAREHSQNMAKKKVKFGHDGFDERFKKMQKVLRLRSFGENVFYCYNVKEPLPAAVKGWMDSPGHRDNILGKYTITGVGIAIAKDGSYYMTQLFASKK